ncbi:P-selectin [Phyllostomus hastatus]|uniref:P-selectin n=1 Tax=Phyllostomus hastatus TaxID=9423 RepID=UPI001E681F42|nr:P-selectin [Phyllostomus hastatus]XP_045694513.1 P-selectin [Phyllostomus hastatus]
MASCLGAHGNWRPRGVFRAAQLLCLSALISELTGQCGVAAWTYNYSSSPYSWNSSRLFCQRFFTDLVAIQNKDEIAYLNDVLPYYKDYYWIGIRKINNNWTWVGTKKTLTKEAENWADDEPNNKKNNQDCVEIYIKSVSAPGKWNDEPCGKRKRALCYTASCRDAACSRQGDCIETIGNYTCSCYPGFYGPDCEYVRECGALELPQRVLMNCSHPLGDFSFHSQCSFHCADGYTLDGARELECLASGTWSNKPPSCVATPCPPLRPPERGSMRCLHAAGAPPGQSSCSFSCEEGSVLVGPELVQCTASGVWTASPPVCRAVACEPLASPAHGSVACAPSSGPFQHNASCSFRCAGGFVLSGADTVRCAGTGQWTAPAPVCQALQCQGLRAPDRARMNCTHRFGAFQYQSTCSFACDEGSVLAGASELQCLATGAWSAHLPECRAVTCTPLPSPKNGTVTCDQPLGHSTYKSTCHFTCDEGFSLTGLQSLDCTASGHWTGLPPTCEAIRCPELLAPERGRLNCSDTRGEFNVGSTCRFSCQEGFRLEGSDSVTCAASGRWTAPLPTCKGATAAPMPAVRCPALVTPEQGTVSCRHRLAAFGPDTTCSFGCQAGFTLRGERELRCRPSGQWTAATPACAAVKCPELPVADPLLMNCSDPWGQFSYGSACTFHCPEGQPLTGSARTACQHTGQWSAAVPTCQAGPLTVQEALTYFGGAVACATGLAIGGTLLALLRRRCRQKDDGKSPLSPHSQLGTYGVFSNAAFDPTP